MKNYVVGLVAGLLLFAVLLVPAAQDRPSVAAGSYCSNTGCFGSNSFENSYLYEGVKCFMGEIGNPNCMRCTNGSWTEVAAEVIDGSQTCYTAGARCGGICDDAPSDARSVNGYPIGHRCTLRGKTGTYECVLSANGGYGTFQLVASAPAAPTSTSSSSKTVSTSGNTQSTDQNIEAEKLDFQMPEKYRAEGSTSTDLTKISVDEAKAYKGLRIDDVDNAIVEFSTSLDLTSDEVKKSISGEEQVIRLEKGLVSIDTDVAPSLAEVPASITMKGLEFGAEDFVILRNQNPAEDYVSNISYDQENDVLSFDVKGFSTYEAKLLKDLDLVSDSQSKADNVNHIAIILVAAGIGVVSSSIGLVVVRRLILKRRKIKKAV